jgi:hypothetical protein
VLPGEPADDSVIQRATQNALWTVDVGAPSGRVEEKAVDEDPSNDVLGSIAITQIHGIRMRKTPKLRCLNYSSFIGGSDTGDAGLTLQEAFARKRQGFIKTQATRHAEAKEKVRKGMVVKMPSAVEESRGMMLKTISDWKKKKQTGPPPKGSFSLFISLCFSMLCVLVDLPDVVEKNSSDRKKAEKEAKARTERFVIIMIMKLVFIL